ncbi:hypothetical protein D9M68_701040 [compost metagenome]
MLDHAVRADLDAIFDHHATFEDHVDIDQHIAANGDVATQVEARRIAQGHPLGHQAAGGTLLVVAFQFGQLDTVVGALHFHGVQGLLGRHHQAVGHRHGDHVGQVILALGIAVG